MISSLIRYADTHTFFDNHYGEIQDLKHEWEYGSCEPLRIE